MYLVTDNLFAQGAITQNLMAVSFKPTIAAVPVINGEVTFGGVDPSKFTESITFTCVHQAITPSA